MRKRTQEELVWDWVICGILTLAAVFTFACFSRRLPVAEPSRSESTPWCFRLELWRNERWQLGTACAETEPTCRHVAAQARRWGGIAKLQHVGDCKDTSR